MSRRLRLLRGHEGERGAVLLEFAIVVVLMIVLLAGAFDYGMAWRTGLATNEAARTGARVGSGSKSDVNADHNLLSGVRSALASSGLLDDVELVSVFRAGSADGAVPSGCTRATSPSGTCNVLTGDQLRALAATPSGAINGTGCITSSQLRNWCPTNREDVQADADYLGVYVRVEHDLMFSVNGSVVTVERTAVMRLEPKEDGT